MKHKASIQLRFAGVKLLNSDDGRGITCWCEKLGQRLYGATALTRDYFVRHRLVVFSKG